MKKVYVMMLVGIFLMVGMTAFAWGPYGRGGASFVPCVAGYGPGGTAWADLNLSKEQTDKMWQLREKFHTDTQAIRFDLFQKQMELKALYADPKAAEAAITAKQKEVDVARDKLRDKMTLFGLEQRKILTPEQIKKLSEIRGNRGYGRGMGMGPGGGMGRGMGMGPGAGMGLCPYAPDDL